jgi:hypothetical protein
VNKNGVPAHDRLDFVQHAEEFSSPVCGTPNRLTGKPDYCCFDCPTLVAHIAEFFRLRTSTVHQEIITD